MLVVAASPVLKVENFHHYWEKKKKKGEREEWMTKQSFEFVLVTIRYKIHCKVKIPTVIAPAFCRQ